MTTPFEILIQGRHIPNGINFVYVSYRKREGRVSWGMPTPMCPVRHCGEPLERRERSLVCPRGHSFDLARSGYAHLLQPQDRRSQRPGDPPEAVEARRRLLDAGHGEPLLQALPEEIAALGLGAGAA